MTEEIKIWAIQDASAVTLLESKSQVDTEELLEEILTNNPQMLLSGLRLIGRQTPVSGGALDLLGVDKDGKLVVFELKRGTLARDAVAQIIDYASDLDAMDIDTLARHITERSGERGIEEIADFQEWYSRDFESLEGFKPLRMCLVGLGSDDTTERMFTFLANNSGMDISLITFHGFEHDGKFLLAKRVHVEGTSASEQRPSRSYRSVAERREMLEKLVGESGVSELFTVVRKKFQECWPRCTENINPRSIGFNLAEQTENGRRARSLARMDVLSGSISLVFYGRTLILCPEGFAQAKQHIDFKEYRSRNEDRTYDEWSLSLDSTGWDAYEERLTALMRAVYRAWEGREEL